VTHVLLTEGTCLSARKWGIPIGAVTGVSEDGIQLNVTKHQVQGLPPADIDHPDG
jgi:hypothetical protein